MQINSYQWLWELKKLRMFMDQLQEQVVEIFMHTGKCVVKKDTGLLRWRQRQEEPKNNSSTWRREKTESVKKMLKLWLSLWKDRKRKQKRDYWRCKKNKASWWHKHLSIRISNSIQLLSTYTKTSLIKMNKIVNQMMKTCNNKC